MITKENVVSQFILRLIHYCRTPSVTLATKTNQFNNNKTSVEPSLKKFDPADNHREVR